jgi:hypothetical protein
MHPEENGAADISAVCEANALTKSPQFQGISKDIPFFFVINNKNPYKNENQRSFYLSF